MLGCASMWLAGCVEAPSEFVQRLDAALASEDPARVAAMLTPESRPMFQTLQRVQPAPLPDPASAVVSPVGHAAFVPARPAKSTRFVSAHQDSSGIIFKVEADGERREWVMRQSGLRWQLDLLATSSRSSWAGF